MRRDEVVAGETIEYTLSGLNFTNATLYFSLKKKKEENVYALKKKWTILDEVAVVQITGDETWGLEGDYYAEFFAVLSDGAQVCEQFVISFEKRLLGEKWT